MAKRASVQTSGLTNADVQTGRADFDKKSFDVLIRQKGLKLKHYEATRCPCTLQENGNAIPSCVNCHGFGWIYPTVNEVVGVVQSINNNPKNFRYNEANLGVAMLTLSNKDKLGWFDKIKIIEGETIFSELMDATESNSQGKYLARSIYPPSEIENVFEYKGSDQPYEVLSESDYTVNGNLWEFNESKKVSVRYLHQPEYVVMDISKDIRNTPLYEQQEKIQKMPVHATIKKLHMMFQDD